MKRQDNGFKKTERQRERPLAHRCFRLLFCLVFFAVCSIPLLAMITGFQSPNLEKRTLARKPAVFTDGQINWQYTYELEQYFADHFPLRPYMISGWHHLRQFLFRQSGSERVISGDDGWLFFEETLNDYLVAEPLSALDFKRLERIITLQHDWLQRRGIDFIFTVAPNKNSIYGEKMPDNFEPITEKNITDRLNQMLADANYLDLFAPLQQLAATSEQPLYHQLDSHWNNIGARQASIAIIERAHIKNSDLSAANLPGPSYESQKNWVGDLAVMLYPSGPPNDWQYYFFDREAYRYTRPLRSLEDLLIQTHYDQGQYNMLMFRDSFANALIPMLSHVFANAVYSRALPFDYGLLDGYDADLVVVEIVERNLEQLLNIPPRLPADPIEQVPFSQNEADIPVIATEDIMIRADYDQEWLKISACFFDQALQEADRVIVGFPGISAASSVHRTGSGQSGQEKAFFEAFPIINPADLTNTTAQNGQQQAEHGMTLYLSDIQWQEIQQVMEIYIQSSQGWQKIEVSITLPVYP